MGDSQVRTLPHAEDSIHPFKVIVLSQSPKVLRSSYVSPSTHTVIHSQFRGDARRTRMILQPARERERERERERDRQTDRERERERERKKERDIYVEINKINIIYDIVDL